MFGWVQKARRLAVVGSVAIVVGIPTIACMGGETVVDPVVTPTPVPVPVVADPAKKIVGTWRMVPPESELRNLKVINAALNGKPAAKEKLGTMTGDETALFNMWKSKSGDEAKAMKAQLKFMKNCQFEITDTQVTVKFEDEQFGPSNYTVVSATEANTTIKFDPGLGNGMETHSIDWSSPTEGVDHISSGAGGDFIPLNVIKR